MIMKSVMWVCIGMYGYVTESVTECSELVRLSLLIVKRLLWEREYLLQALVLKQTVPLQSCSGI